MDILLKINAKNDLLKILANHLKCRWRISNWYIFCVLVLIAFILYLPFLMDILYSKSLTAQNEFTSSIAYLVMIITFFAIIMKLNRTSVFNVFSEILYTTKIFSMSNEMYDSIVSNYMKRKIKFGSFIPTKLDRNRKDNIVVNIVVLKLFSLYFNNINRMGDKKIVSSILLKELFDDMKFDQFYNTIFFDVKKSKKNDMLKILLLDSVTHQLISKSWFNEYYNPDLVNKLIQFVLDQWYELSINYEITDKK